MSARSVGSKTFLSGFYQNVLDDSDVLYRLRRARQLLKPAKQRQMDHSEAIGEMIDDDELIEDLRELEYAE